MEIIITHMYVSEAAHLQVCLRDFITPVFHPGNRCGASTPSTVIALYERHMMYSPTQISFTEFNSDTTQKLPFGISTTNELIYVTTTPIIMAQFLVQTYPARCRYFRGKFYIFELHLINSRWVIFQLYQCCFQQAMYLHSSPQFVAVYRRWRYIGI